MRKIFAQQTLDDATRRRAFWIVAPLIVGVVVALATLAGPRKDHTAAPTAGAPTSAAPAGSGDARIVGAPTRPATPAAAPSQTAPASPAALTARDRSAISAQAEAFLSAFLRYEVGRAGTAVSRTFARTATPALRTRLRRHPPRQPVGMSVAMGRIETLELSDDPDARPLVVAATIERRGRVSATQMVLVERDGRWLVDEIA